MISNDKTGCSTIIPVVFAAVAVIEAVIFQWVIENPPIPAWILWAAVGVCIIWWLIADTENTML